MTEADRIFERFPEFIREYIFTHRWESLRGVQVAAARTLFLTDHHLLLTSSTASGKTEAAFFPILSDLCENPPASVGALYICPLKSLINDQFARMEEILDMTGIRVTRWHGDVAQSHKKKLLEKPSGILQITPESLEAMLINRSNDILRLFGDLRYIVIDEIHTLTGSDRGNQIICQLTRIGHLIGRPPRRIGLSATIGDPNLAADWLAGDTGIPVDVPTFEEGKIKWRLGLEHFYIQNTKANQASEPSDIRQEEALSEQDESAPMDYEKALELSTARAVAASMVESALPKTAAHPLDAGYEYMYDCVKDKKSLVFSNSREETEYLCATLRQIAKARGERDVFLIHHGNLSASLREEAEAKMKDEEMFAVTCATVTMELGIDIGRLERVLQSQAPNSVSSFLQRLGRSGRRGEPPEMMMVFREEDPLPNTPLPQLIPWELLRGIAIIQLYIEERFIEPPCRKQMPMSLLFHQTLSVLAASGELPPRRLAERVLSLPPFSEVTKEDYRTLMVSMIEHDFIEMTEEKGLIVGLAGERLLKSFKFYAVFKDSEDFTVRAGSDEIGTITTPPPVGDRFALAGRVWEVEELDIQRKLIYVKQVDGKMEVSWPGDFGEIHTKILKRMRKILEEDTAYPYLKPNAMKRIEVARHVARNTGMLTHSLVSLGGYTWCLFPWLGTRSFRTLRKFIARNSSLCKISNLEFEGCYYITFRMERGNDYDLISHLAGIVETDGIDCVSLVQSGEVPIFEKYDEHIPGDLLRRAFAVDRLRADEAEARLKEILAEY
ncbi:MAG: DEAD/DEAH box helicase [Ruminococcaceae bacterium]|nr:DEAD/DEAH box helicase [Oscillospiraceae bacterium]